MAAKNCKTCSFRKLYPMPHTVNGITIYSECSKTEKVIEDCILKGSSLHSQYTNKSHICWELTMPNSGSWNGRWSGENKKYYIIIKIQRRGNSFTKILELLKQDESKSVSFYYNFGDGWGANVSLSLINTLEARERKKISAGFCGYDWMIESILQNGKIISSKII